MSTQESAITRLHGYPADVLAFEVHGKLRRRDYEEILIPALKTQIRDEGKVKLLYVVHDDFAGMSLGALWDDAKLGLLHLGDFARIAVVTDIEWMAMASKLFAPLVRCPVHVFALAQVDEARVWICDNRPPAPEAKPAVDVSHKLPLTEDRLRPDP